MNLKWMKQYKNEDWIYKNNVTNTARYVLGVKGDKPLIVFGINPSTASDKEPDHTLVRVEKFASLKHCDSWIMLNLYPYRETDIKKLVNYKREFHDENIKHIKEILDKYPDATIVAAWGNIDNKLRSSVKRDIMNCLQDINEIIANKGLKWLALKDMGYPVHFLFTGKGFKLYKVDLVNFSPEF